MLTLYFAIVYIPLMDTNVYLLDSFLQRVKDDAKQLQANHGNATVREDLRRYRLRANADAITDSLNQVYHSQSSQLNPGLQHLQTISLLQNRWK